MKEKTRIEQGARLAAARKDAGYKSAREAALSNQWVESSYRTHENGTRTIGQDDAERYANRYRTLGAKVTGRYILYGDGLALSESGKLALPLKEPDMNQEGFYRPLPDFLGKRDLRVYASVEGGPGEIVVSTEPIDLVPRPWFLERSTNAYAVVVTGESMEPVYEAGDMVLVNPKAPLIKGKDAIFTSEVHGGDFRASIKRYMGATNSFWLAKQFNPPEGQSHDLHFDRNEWSQVLRVVGKYIP